MPSWQVLATNALLYGAVLSLVLGAVITISFVLAPDIWVGDYPPDIRAKFGEMSPRAARLRPFVAVPFFVSLAAIPLLALSRLADRVGAVPFLPAFASTFLVLLVFNTFDLVLADWLIFCKIQPRRVILPGTEGMAGYRDYRFHFVGFLKGLGFCLAAALIIAGAWISWRGISV